MKQTVQKQPNTRPIHPTDASLWLILLLLFITACTRNASTSPASIQTESAPRVIIDRVQVTQGTGIYVTGGGTVPDGGCVKTELLADGAALAWWPRDICVEVGAGRWELLTALGRDGAPEQLDSNVQYEMRAWWPEQPDTSSTRFPFDLEGPPQP